MLRRGRATCGQSVGNGQQVFGDRGRSHYRLASVCLLVAVILSVVLPGLIAARSTFAAGNTGSSPSSSPISVLQQATSFGKYDMELPATQKGASYSPNPHDDFWLHGVGSQLYTSWGDQVTLKAVNWYGFEHAPFVPDGLNRAPLDSILYSVRHLGFNALRITFADQTVRSNPIVRTGLDANPKLQGMHSLDILGVILNRAHHFGLRVVLCNMRSEAGYGPESQSGLWYTKQYTSAMWMQDWELLVKRFANESALVGADLRNEPHVVGPGTVNLATYLKYAPLWGPVLGKEDYSRDWHWAAQTLGNDLLKINPKLLIVVEGVQLYLNPTTKKVTGGLWGSNLIPVAYDPIRLTHPGQLVYSVHEYGPQMWQGNWFNPRTTVATLNQRWNKYWGYLLSAAKSLQAPIFVGEFGTCHDYWSCISSPDGWKQGFWFLHFVDYLHAHPQVGWAYWALNPVGPFDATDPNFYSVFSADWHHYYPLLVRGLGPILSEPDGTNRYGKIDHLQAFPPQPGCFPDKSCVTVIAHLPNKIFPVVLTRNIPYVRPADPYRMGDLYMPQHSGSARVPAVVIVHGGSWDNGVKGTSGTVVLAKALAQRGFATFDINYRLAGRGGQYPRDIQDVDDAVAYLTVHAAALHIDPLRIAVTGISAGGYLALMAGYRANVAPFVPIHYPRTRIMVRAVGSFFAPVELKATVINASTIPRLKKLAAYMGTTWQQNHLLYRNGSPLRYTNTAVPTFVWYGRNDPMTPLEQTYEFYKRLRQHQVQAGLVDLPGAPHTLTELKSADRAKVVDQLLGFLASVFSQPLARKR